MKKNKNNQTVMQTKQDNYETLKLSLGAKLALLLDIIKTSPFGNQYRQILYVIDELLTDTLKQRITTKPEYRLFSAFSPIKDFDMKRLERFLDRKTMPYYTRLLSSKQEAALPLFTSMVRTPQFQESYSRKTQKKLRESFESVLFSLPNKKEGAKIEGKQLYDLYKEKYEKDEKPLPRAQVYQEFLNFAAQKGISLQKKKGAKGAYFLLKEDADLSFLSPAEPPLSEQKDQRRAVALPIWKKKRGRLFNKSLALKKGKIRHVFAAI